MSDRVGSSQQAIKIFLQIYLSKISSLIFSASLAENWDRKNILKFSKNNFEKFRTIWFSDSSLLVFLLLSNDFGEERTQRRSLFLLCSSNQNSFTQSLNFSTLPIFDPSPSLLVLLSLEVSVYKNNSFRLFGNKKWDIKRKRHIYKSFQATTNVIKEVWIHRNDFHTISPNYNQMTKYITHDQSYLWLIRCSIWAWINAPQ